jgi:membrane associated rhomboid family serine protease
MFPYRDENETVRTPVVTFVIIAANVAAWFLVQDAGGTSIDADGSVSGLAASVCNLGLIPGELLLQVKPGAGFTMGDGLVCTMDPGRQPSHILTSMFLLGGWMHLLGNMWFLWIFGNNVEDSMGRGRFVVFYLLCGLGAAVAQVLSDPSSMIPMVGASGAIGGVMGAYVMLYPRVRVYTAVFLGFFFTSIAVPAWVMLGYWMVLQVVGGFQAMMVRGGGVAFWAHIGGFLAGVLLIRLFSRPEYIAQHRAQQWQPRRVGWHR